MGGWTGSRRETLSAEPLRVPRSASTPRPLMREQAHGFLRFGKPPLSAGVNIKTAKRPELWPGRLGFGGQNGIQAVRAAPPAAVDPYRAPDERRCSAGASRATGGRRR